MTRACLSFLAGMYALQLNSFAEISDYPGALLLAIAAISITRRCRLMFCFAAGAGLYLLAAESLIDSRISPYIAGDSIVATVNVEDFPVRRNATVSLVARPLHDDRLPSRIRLSWFHPPVAIHNGDCWQLELRMRRPRGNRNPGGFDSEAWLFREGIAAVGYVVDGPRNRLLRCDATRHIERARGRFVARAKTLLAHPEQAAVVAAIGVGARHMISTEQWQRYAATGSSHLMAISGLHVGLAAIASYLVVFWLAGWLRLGGPHRNSHRLALATSLLLAIAYARVSGLAVPAQRASLMLLLAGACLLARRRPDILAVLAMACLAIVIADPLTTMRPGFSLSFAAVAILLWLSRRRRINFLAFQVNLLFGLFPLTALLFGRISVAALPVNLIAIPLFSFLVVPLTFAGLVMDGLFEPIGDWCIVLAGQIVGQLERLLRFFADQRWAAHGVPTLFPVCGFFILLTAAWTVLPVRWPGRYLAWLGLVAALTFVPRPPADGCARVTVLDVGHGLAVVIRTRFHVVLYDTGPGWRGGGSAAETVVLPFLRSFRVDAVDRLVVSHGDLDHAGGVTALVTGLDVRRVLSGEALAGIPSTPCRAGQRWSYDGVDYSILHPHLAASFDGNDRSCVLLVQTGSYRLLLTGDIEQPAESALVAGNRLTAVSVAIVPHHGSRTSSTAPFIRAVRPRVAIVSAGFGNHWGFPKQDVLARWRDAGARIVNTADAGAIDFELCATSGLGSINGYRDLNRRIWHE